jgi:hypothetical protein
MDEAAARHAADYALGRVSTARDVANACVFLASDAARQITGVDLPVDGGWARFDDIERTWDMTALKITAGDFTFDARLEEEKAPLTCAAFRKVMPFSGPDRACPLVGRGRVDSARRYGFRRGLREPHELPVRGADHPLSRRDQRDRDPAGLWRDLLRLQDGAAGRQPLHHADQQSRPADGAGQFSVLWKGAHDIRFEFA